jgi:hypothetical protein
MAKMYPDDIEDFEKATPGEKKVFRFLKEAARPHKDFVCWYEPPVGSTGKTPDFILFRKDLGLLVLEVKDWAIDQIIESSPFEFTIRSSDKDKKRKSPDKQAKGYVNALMDRLKEAPDFVTNAFLLFLEILEKEQPEYEDELRNVGAYSFEIFNTRFV